MPRGPRVSLGRRWTWESLAMPGRPRISLSRRWIWGSLAVPLAAILALIVGGLLGGSGGSGPSLQSALNVSDTLGPPAAIDRARLHAHAVAVAEARRAAERRRELEAAAAAAAARKAAAKHAQRTTTTAPEPVVAPLPPLSGGGGGGGSSGGHPDLQHGIGSVGGGQPPSSGSG